MRLSDWLVWVSCQPLVLEGDQVPGLGPSAGHSLLAAVFQSWRLSNLGALWFGMCGIGTHSCGVSTGVCRVAMLVDEGLLSLLGLMCNGPSRFGVQVVLLVFIDFGQPLCCMLVNFIVVLVKNGLPGLFVGIVDLGCPLPSG